MKRIFAMLRNHFWLKVSALLFAIILWTFVMTQVDPYREKTVSNVIIRYDTSVLDEKKLQLRGELSEIFPDVEVVVRLKLSRYNELSNNNITITADLSNISAAGEYEIELKAESTIGDVASISPKTVLLDVDNLISVTVPVSAVKVNKMPDGLVDGDVYISPADIAIYGAQRDLEQADKAVFEIDLSKVTEDINSRYEVKVLDKEGEEMSSSLFVQQLPSVNVQMNVLHKKTVPINYDKSSLANLDSLPDGYEIVDVKLVPQESVEIKGTEEDLAQIESLDVNPISIEGIDPENPSEIPVDLILPNGIELVNPVQLRAQVIIERIPDDEESTPVMGTASGGSQ